jgi:hypothetical protein
MSGTATVVAGIRIVSMNGRHEQLIVGVQTVVSYEILGVLQKDWGLCLSSPGCPICPDAP